MVLLTFVYRDAAGAVSQRALANFRESGHYVEGACTASHRFLTFRKDRIVEYLDGCDALLSDPFAPPPPKPEPRQPADKRPQVLFTGFPSVQRAHLESLADAGGLRVVRTVTDNLTFLCTGPNAGPSKVAKARLRGAYIMDQAELATLLETGELPDHAIDDLV